MENKIWHVVTASTEQGWPLDGILRWAGLVRRAPDTKGSVMVEILHSACSMPEIGHIVVLKKNQKKLQRWCLCSTLKGHRPMQRLTEHHKPLISTSEQCCCAHHHLCNWTNQIPPLLRQYLLCTWLCYLCFGWSALVAVQTCHRINNMHKKEREVESGAFDGGDDELSSVGLVEICKMFLTQDFFLWVMTIASLPVFIW